MKAEVAEGIRRIQPLIQEWKPIVLTPGQAVQRVRAVSLKPLLEESQKRLENYRCADGRSELKTSRMKAVSTLDYILWALADRRMLQAGPTTETAYEGIELVEAGPIVSIVSEPALVRFSKSEGHLPKNLTALAFIENGGPISVIARSEDTVAIEYPLSSDKRKEIGVRYSGSAHPSGAENVGELSRRWIESAYDGITCDAGWEQVMIAEGGGYHRATIPGNAILVTDSSTVCSGDPALQSLVDPNSLFNTRFGHAGSLYRFFKGCECVVDGVSFQCFFPCNCF